MTTVLFFLYSKRASGPPESPLHVSLPSEAAQIK